MLIEGSLRVRTSKNLAVAVQANLTNPRIKVTDSAVKDTLSNTARRLQPDKINLKQLGEMIHRDLIEAFEAATGRTILTFPDIGDLHIVVVPSHVGQECAAASKLIRLEIRLAAAEARGANE